MDKILGGIVGYFITILSCQDITWIRQIMCKYITYYHTLLDWCDS